jgi:hypothetical protein
MSGGRVFDLVAGGADVTGNDYAHHGLGGQVLSPSQVATILDEQQQEYDAQHSKDSILARAFDTNSNNSLITKAVMATPTSLNGFRTSLAGIFSNPFKNIFASLPFAHAQAAENGSDPFGITQYGYSANDPAFTSDPEEYWVNNCSTDGTTIDPNLPVNKNYHAGYTINPDTQMPENSTTDPCYLIQAAVGSAGAMFDSSLLTQDDQGSQ